MVPRSRTRTIGLLICLIPFAEALASGDPSGHCARRDVLPRLRPGSERNISALPRIIHKSEKFVLSWYVPNADDVLVEYSDDTDRILRTLGRFPAQGSLESWPRTTTMYVISHGNPQVRCVESIWVMVR